jgi:hypothetical protein
MTAQIIYTDRFRKPREKIDLRDLLKRSIEQHKPNEGPEAA